MKFQYAVFHVLFPDGKKEGTSYDNLLYPRLNNTPNHVEVAQRIAVLEGGEEALITASGMAAISTALLTVVGGGGHILVQSTVYGGLHTFLTDGIFMLINFRD